MGDGNAYERSVLREEEDKWCQGVVTPGVARY